MCSTSCVSMFLCGLQLLAFQFCIGWTSCKDVTRGHTTNLMISFSTVAIMCHLNEVLSCSLLRQEHAQQMREKTYAAVLQHLKTPLLLARSELQSFDVSSGPPSSSAVLAATMRIEELWRILTKITVV